MQEKESRPRSSYGDEFKKNSKNSNRHSSLSNKSGGRLSIPFLLEEEKALPLHKREDEDPIVASNLPDKIFNEA